MSLFWRVFVTNAALLVAAAAVLGISPVTVSWPIALTEAIVLVTGVAAMLVANAVLLRPTFAPLERLAQQMRAIDLLRPGQRPEPAGSGEVIALVAAFNEMLDRLETERRESSRRAVTAQEEERKRIAAELHDEVGQAMTAVLMSLERLRPDVAPRRLAELDDAREAVRASLEEVRRIAAELRPEMLEHLGLVSALTALARAFSARTGIEVERRFAYDLPALSTEVELALYRIAQESLTNAARHSGADRVRVGLERGGAGVLLRVSDNGRGLEGRPAGTGGLRGMQERAVIVGGDLALRRAVDGGVEVRFEVPAAEPTATEPRATEPTAGEATG